MLAGGFHHPDAEVLRPESLVSQQKQLRQREASVPSRDEVVSQRTGAAGCGGACR